MGAVGAKSEDVLGKLQDSRKPLCKHEGWLQAAHDELEKRFTRKTTFSLHAVAVCNWWPPTLTLVVFQLTGRCLDKRGLYPRSPDSRSMIMNTFGSSRFLLALLRNPR